MADIVDGRFADSLGNTRYALEGTGRFPRPAGTGPEMDAWGRHLDTNQPVTWEMKHGKSPTGAQREALFREIEARARLAQLSGGRVIVELRGQAWSPKLKQDIIEIGTRLGVVVEVIP